MADGGNYIPFPDHPQTHSQVDNRTPQPRFRPEALPSSDLQWQTPVLTGHVLRHGLHIWPGIHCGPVPPSAFTWIEFESVPTSNRLPTSKSKNPLTMELLFEWIGKFNRGNVGFNWGVFS
jgi:hypothetical protein